MSAFLESLVNAVWSIWFVVLLAGAGIGLALLTNNEVNFDYSPGWLPGW